MGDMMYFSTSLFMLIFMVGTAIYIFCRINGCETEEPERYTEVASIQFSSIRILLFVEIIIGVGFVLTTGLYVIWR